jgi:hypothetical protein
MADRQSSGESRMKCVRHSTRTAQAEVSPTTFPILHPMKSMNQWRDEKTSGRKVSSGLIAVAGVGFQGATNNQLLQLGGLKVTTEKTGAERVAELLKDAKITSTERDKIIESLYFDKDGVLQSFYAEPLLNSMTVKEYDGFLKKAGSNATVLPRDVTTGYGIDKPRPVTNTKGECAILAGAFDELIAR